MAVLACYAACSACASVSARKSVLPSVAATLVVSDMTEDAVLANARGQVDLIRDGKPTAEIPGCSRDVSRKGMAPVEGIEPGDYVEFGFHKADTGLYTLWLRPKRTQRVTIWSVRSTQDVTSCRTTIGDVTLTGGEWSRVDVRFAEATPADKCAVAISRPVQAHLPKAIERLLEGPQ